MNRSIAIAILLVASIGVIAQDNGISRLGHHLQIELESTTNTGGGAYAPMWLSANRYGLSSVLPNWNYERVSLRRDRDTDSLRNWRIGYGANMAVMFGGEQYFCMQEAYIEASWKRIYIKGGSKQEPLELKNAQLSSGGLSYGINARPIPQITIGADYFPFPWTRHWWYWKAHISYGWKTDGGWQQRFAKSGTRRTKGTLYHEKALYWKIGNTHKFPLELEAGLQWATEFGGTSYNFDGRGYSLEKTKNGIKLGSGFRSYINALFALGNDITDGDRPNVEGNHFGSWNIALSWKGKDWHARVYAERMFEDFSQLGVRYGISDHLVGIEVVLPKNQFISTVVLEHLNSREQSGAIFHDVTNSIPDQMDGRDNYYNHHIYTGWQNYGMVMGNPLLTSPLYNHAFGKQGEIYCPNNRVRAWHIGLSGNPLECLQWRTLLTFTRNWGTYDAPFADPSNQIYFLFEGAYSPKCWHNFSAKFAFGLDHGTMLGNNTGCQFTIIKRFNVK